MNGLIHLGEKNYEGGRSGEPNSRGITKQLIELGFTHGRMKTGTPKIRRENYRLLKNRKTVRRHVNPENFHIRNKFFKTNHSCYITYTSDEVHEILKERF